MMNPADFFIEVAFGHVKTSARVGDLIGTAFAERLPIGARWRQLGAARPHKGSELEQSKFDALSRNLSKRAWFTRAELSKFGVKDLRDDHYIRSADVFYKLLTEEEPLGSKWQRLDLVAPVKPSVGEELTNQDLADALSSKVIFTREELQAFGIGHGKLRSDDFIMSSDSHAYYRPAGAPLGVKW